MRHLILLALAAMLTGCAYADHCFYTDDNQTCSIIGHRAP